MEKEQSNFIFYAAREIVFVVIGILIAVSINNWNETRKQHNELTNILSNIKEEIKNDIEKIDVVLEDYSNKEQIYENILNGKYTTEDYEGNPGIGFIILGYPEISFSRRGVSTLEKFTGHVDVKRALLTQEIIKFYNEQLWEIKVDDDLRAQDFIQNFNYWKNNTEWWADYVQIRLTKGFIDYAINSKDYQNRVATAHFYAYKVYLPEIEKFKTMGLEIIQKIEAFEGLN